MAWVFSYFDYDGACVGLVGIDKTMTKEGSIAPFFLLNSNIYKELYTLEKALKQIIEIKNFLCRIAQNILELLEEG